MEADMKFHRRQARAAMAALGCLIASPAVAQDDEQGIAPPATQAAAAPAGDDQELAKQLSNPVASLISVPLQENIDFGLGPTSDGYKSTLNVQPVVPLALGSNWNLIVRTILPVIYQNDVIGPGTDEFGLGDVTQSFFFSPRKPGPGGIVWAVGPALLYPTATDSALGGGKWGAGPTALVLKQSGQNTIGLLANHIWSFAGDDARGKVSATFIQPFFSHTTAKATTFTLNSETSYDWVGKHWVVPVNVMISQLTKLGNQRVSIGGGVRYYAEKPAGGPAWGVRLVLTMLFPKG
jgi:hypothetical protein